MSFKSFNASQKKMYLFALFVIDTLKNSGIVRQDFDTFNLDLSLVDTFDYDAFATEYKAHFKKPRANKILKHSSQVVRDTSNDVVINVANEYYENISFDMNAASAAVEVEVPAEKPKRKYSRKPKTTTGVVVAAAAAAADISIDDLTSALDNMMIQTETIAAAMNSVVEGDVAADEVGTVGAVVTVDAVGEKPKRKVTRKPKAAPAVADSIVAEVGNVSEKPKRKSKAAATATTTVADEVGNVSEKPKRKSKATVAAAAVDAGVADENKRKYTKKTAIQYLDETVPELTAKIVVAAISGVNEDENKNIIPAASASVPVKAVKAKRSKKVNAVNADDNHRPSTPILSVDDNHRPSTPILSVENELTTEDDYVNEISAAYYKDDDGEGECEGEGEEDDVIRTCKYNIRGTDYLIGDNNVVYDYQTQNTIGKFDSQVGVILYNK